jgi:hypothetical protein
MACVFLLSHAYEDEQGCEHAFLLGVYSSRAAAERRVATARLLAGFRRHPTGFVIDECQIDEDMWTEGFATATSSGWLPDPDRPADNETDGDERRS